MMNALLAARDYLDVRYRDLLGPSFEEFGAQLDEALVRPAWLWSDASFRPLGEAEGEGEGEGEGALLLDPDIGVCLFLAPYENKLALRKQVVRALSVASRLLPTPDWEVGQGGGRRWAVAGRRPLDGGGSGRRRVDGRHGQPPGPDRALRGGPDGRCVLP